MKQQQQQQEQNIYVNMLNEVYRAYDHFNKIFTSGTLPRPVITITSTGKKNANGWFCGNSWQKTSGEKIHEIRLCPDTIKTDGIEEFLMVLLHEVAHLKNKVNKIPDCTATQYHNEAFKKAAESFGLVVSKLKNRGWARTDLGENAKEAIKTLQPKKHLYTLYLNHLPDPDSKKKDKKEPKYKERVPASKETVDAIVEGIELDPESNSQREFVENAVKFYNRYLKGEFAIVNNKNL